MIHKRYAVRDANDTYHHNLGTFFTARAAKRFAKKLGSSLDHHPYVVKGKIK